MDFYVDLAVAVLLRIIKDRRGVKKYYPALAKLHDAIVVLFASDPTAPALLATLERETK